MIHGATTQQSYAAATRRHHGDTASLKTAVTSMVAATNHGARLGLSFLFAIFGTRQVTFQARERHCIPATAHHVDGKRIVASQPQGSTGCAPTHRGRLGRRAMSPHTHSMGAATTWRRGEETTSGDVVSSAASPPLTAVNLVSCTAKLYGLINS